MIGIKDVYKLQSDYNVSDGTFKEAEITFEDYMIQCRMFLARNLPEEYTKGSWDAEKKQNVLLNLASEFVDKHKVKVRGYLSAVGGIDSELLFEDVCDAITGASIIKEALDDPGIDEVQINDKNTIFVVRRGVTIPYVDSRGRIMQFASNDEIHILLNRLIDDGTGNIPQFTDGLPLLNAKTAKHQYRVSAVHHVANTMDKPPHNFPITSAVIRKFREIKLTVDDLISGNTITEKMGRLLDKFGRAELKLFCVGPTGSGKTTLLNIIAGTIPLGKRIILVQNPTEITFMDRDEMGRNVRNVVHWEVKEVGAEEVTNTSISASMDNLISNSLRFSPEIILVGEARFASEFFQINRAMRTGHKLLGTYHAEDSADALGRFATELSSVSNATYSESLKLLSETINIIISQFKFNDGSRKVMEISEICGSDDHGKPIINTLFEYKLTGEVEKVVGGEPVMEGYFEQVGCISEKLQKTFFKAGISKQEIAEFTEEGV